MHIFTEISHKTSALEIAVCDTPELLIQSNMAFSFPNQSQAQITLDQDQVKTLDTRIYICELFVTHQALRTLAILAIYLKTKAFNFCIYFLFKKLR